MRIRALFTRARRRYGSPRIHDDLREAGVPISRKRVARLMRQAGLRARQRQRYRVTTMSEHDQPIAPNHLAQTFVAEAPNQRWVSDTTTFPIGTSGKLYLAAILDLYSRFVVGWAVSAVNDRHLTLNALDQALRRRGPAAGKASINGQSLLPLETTVANGRKLVEIRAPQASRGVFRSPIAP